MGLKVEPWKMAGASEVELAAVVALFRLGLHGQTPSVEKTAVSARALLTEWLGTPKTGVLLARSAGGKVEGLLILRSDPPAVRIVFVAAREPRKGTGTALIGALRDISAARGAKELRVAFTEGDERTRAFFGKKAGFRETGAAEALKPGYPRVEAVLPLSIAG